MKKYKFLESKLPNIFSKDLIKQTKNLIGNSHCFTVIGMPGVGISVFLKYLASQNFANFIHIDNYQLTEPTKSGFLKLLAHELGIVYSKENDLQIIALIKSRLGELISDSDKKLVIVCNRFDHYKNILDEQFLLNLKTLREVNKSKIIFVFSANKPFIFNNANLEMFATYLYLKPYTKKDLENIFKIYNPNVGDSKLKAIIELSGGHTQLAQLILQCDKFNNLERQPFIIMQLARIYTDSFSQKQRNQLKNISKGKYSKIDEYLTNIGVVKNNKLFSRIFSRFLVDKLVFKLSKKEHKLLTLLKKSKDRLVEKDKIFEYVWGENALDATDWALNALIYRLRKKNKNIIIENIKSEGYKLISE